MGQHKNPKHSPPIEQAYRDRVARMTTAERIARSAAMFEWTRQQIARQISAQQGDVDQETLKWMVAHRLYGREPNVCTWIDRKLKDVSG